MSKLHIEILQEKLADDSFAPVGARILTQDRQKDLVNEAIKKWQSEHKWGYCLILTPDGRSQVFRPDYGETDTLEFPKYVRCLKSVCWKCRNELEPDVTKRIDVKQRNADIQDVKRDSAEQNQLISTKYKTFVCEHEMIYSSSLIKSEEMGQKVRDDWQGSCNM